MIAQVVVSVKMGYINMWKTHTQVRISAKRKLDLQYVDGNRGPLSSVVYSNTESFSEQKE